LNIIFKWKRQNGTLFDFSCGVHLILRKADVPVLCDSKFIDALSDLIIVKFTREKHTTGLYTVFTV